MYNIENLTIEDLIFLEGCIYFYKERITDEIIECQIRINKATKEDNTENFKIYSQLLETNQAVKDKCKCMIDLIENIKNNKIN